jgi:chromosome segregation ATPase
MGLAARDKIVKGYSLEKQANEYLALYRELLANQRHNQPTLAASQDNGSGLSLLENQKVALVAIQAGQIALAKERKTALELNNKVIQTETQVQAAQAKLQTTQAQLQTTQAQLQTTQAKLQTTQAKLQTTQAQLQTTQAQLQTTQAEVEAMRSSKFWKMRQLWVDAKSYMGLDS